MKKKFIVFTVCIMIMLTLMACSNNPPATPEEKAQNNHDTNNTASAITFQKYDEFEAIFTELISQVPDFTVSQLDDVVREDGVTCHLWYIKDSILNDSYHLQINENVENEVTFLSLNTERKSYGNMDFAVFSYYSYKAMGFNDLDADEFYKKFDLLSRENIFEQTTYSGYEITSITIDKANQIVFSIYPVD